MNILIAGAGAIGVALGASLASQGMDVTFYARANTAAAIRADGVKRTGIFGELSVSAGQVHVAEDLSALSPGSIDRVLVCSKTLANEEISRKLNENRGLLAADGCIVLLQNGWGNDRPFLRFFEQPQLFQARVITGFTREAQNVSRVTVHTAPILFGSLYGVEASRLQPLAAAISASGIPSEVTDRLAEALWAKMLYNTTLNPLGAILNVPYGKLTESEHTKGLMNAMIRETFAVMNAYGYKTFWNTPEEYMEAFYGRLVPDTYAHRSSTLQDIEKKQRTEIATLNGCIVRLAEEKGLPVPTHSMICEMIRALEDWF